MIRKVKAVPAFIWFIFSVAFALILFTLPNSPVSAADGKLTNQKALEAVWQWFRGHADKVVVTGVLEMPQQNMAQVDLEITGLLVGRPKNDAVTAYAFGPGGGSFEWSGRGKAIFLHYNDGRWVFRELITERGTWRDLNFVVTP